MPKKKDWKEYIPEAETLEGHDPMYLEYSFYVDEEREGQNEMYRGDDVLDWYGNDPKDWYGK
jgi:hypothetical protein